MPPESIEARHGGVSASPTTSDADSSYQRHVAKLLYYELLEAKAPLTVEDLCYRTLLPEPEVREAITSLQERGLCANRQRGGDRQMARFVASRTQ